MLVLPLLIICIIIFISVCIAFNSYCLSLPAMVTWVWFIVIQVTCWMPVWEDMMQEEGEWRSDTFC